MPPRKKSRSRKGASRRTTNSITARWPAFLMGIIAGVVLTTGSMVYYTSDMKMSFGSGIKNFLNSRGSTTVKTGSQAVVKNNDPKPVFDFYTVLPEYETVVDEKQFIREAKKTSSKKKAAPKYILQAASYSSFKDADKLKAKLALNGLTARIEKISVEGKGQFYRVRLGPYSSANTKKDVVKRLGTLGIKPLHLKVETN